MATSLPHIHGPKALTPPATEGYIAPRSSIPSRSLSNRWSLIGLYRMRETRCGAFLLPFTVWSLGIHHPSAKGLTVSLQTNVLLRIPKFAYFDISYNTVCLCVYVQCFPSTFLPCFVLPFGVLLRTMRNHIASWQVARLYESQDQMTFSCSVTMMFTMSYLVLSNITGGCKVR